MPERVRTEPELRPIRIPPRNDRLKIAYVNRALYLAIFVFAALALGAVWVLQPDIEGPPANEQQATNGAQAAEPQPPATREPDVVPTGADSVASGEFGEPLPADSIPDAPVENPPLSSNAATPGSKAPATHSIDAPAPSAPPSTVGPRATTGAASATTGSTDVNRPVRQTPPERRLNLEPPARPPFRSIPESTPPRPATVAAAPPVEVASPSSPAPVTPSPGPVATSPSPGGATTSPSSPRTAVSEATPAPLPRVAIDEPVLRPPATPPSQPADPAPVTAPPTAAARPPAASPTSPPPAPAPAADVDGGAIRDVLGRYRNAFNRMDASAAQQVWPTVNQRTLDRAFGQLEEQTLFFDKCTIAVKDLLAEARCSGSTQFVPRVGNRSVQTTQRQWNFSLRKTPSGGWLIQNVDAR